METSREELTAADVLQAIGRGAFDDGEQLRRIVNAAQKRATYRTAREFPRGSTVRIDGGDSASRWNGVAGVVEKTNPTTCAIRTSRGLVTVSRAWLVAEPQSLGVGR